MNTTSHGRWNRYKEINGVLHKKCNGILHDEDGAWLPITSYWTHKTGARAGKPMSRCPACLRAEKGRDPDSGLVPVDRVWFIFQELEYRIGKAETLRILGISGNLYYRLNHRVYKHMYKKTAKKAMILLRQLRAAGIARHRDSIKHGSAMRGRRERVPTHRHEFNGKDERQNELKRESRARLGY